MVLQIRVQMQRLKNLIRKALRLVATSTIPLRYRIMGGRFPKHLSMTEEQAEKILSDIRPDIGETCLCQNNIHADHALHIIVPVYNTSAYLTECLDSIFQQQTTHSFFVSIINDGSTDNSAELIDAYHLALKDTHHFNNTEVIHQSNQGPSGARNSALNTIRGKYIMFVDSDDKLMPGAIDSLLNAAIASDADIAEGNCNTGPTHGFVWGKVYRAELFRHVHFPPGYWFEDTINIFYLYPLSRRTVQVPGMHCYYRFNQDSIMNTFQGTARTIDSLWVSKRVLDDYFSSGNNATLQLLHDYLQDTLSTASHFRGLNNEEAMQALFAIHCSIANRYFEEYLSNSAHTRHLPSWLRHMASALRNRDYRRFRIVAGK